MKFQFLLCFTLLLTALHAQQSVHFTLGLNHGQVWLRDPQIFIASNGQANLFAGIEGRKEIKSGFSAALQLQWVRRGFKTVVLQGVSEYEAFSYRFDYINLVPRLYSPMFSNTRLFLGAEIGYRIDELDYNETLHQLYDHQISKPLQFGLIPGVSVHFNHWTGMLSYTLGLHRFAQDQYENADGKVFSQDFVHRGFQLGVAYQIWKKTREKS